MKYFKDLFSSFYSIIFSMVFFEDLFQGCFFQGFVSMVCFKVFCSRLLFQGIFFKDGFARFFFKGIVSRSCFQGNVSSFCFPKFFFSHLSNDFFQGVFFQGFMFKDFCCLAQPPQNHLGWHSLPRIFLGLTQSPQNSLDKFSPSMSIVKAGNVEKLGVGVFLWHAGQARPKALWMNILLSTRPPWPTPSIIQRLLGWGR